MTFARYATMLSLFLITPSVLSAHEEPPKTIKERLERDRHRKQVMAAHIKTETVWRISETRTRTRQLRTLYDRNGNPVEQTAFAADTVPAVRVYSHYTLENIPYEQVVIAGADTEKTAFTYLAPRIVATATDFTPSGYVRGRLTYTYTDTLITAKKVDSLDAPAYSILYSYPEGTAQGELGGVRQLDANGRLVQRVANVYSGTLRTEKQVFNAQDSLDFTFLYTYTPAGEFRTLTKQLADGTVAYQRRYHYAKDGMLESVTEHDAAGVLKATLRYEYERYAGEAK
jgi:hypothetical protein